jgi:hypothetical protein
MDLQKAPTSLYRRKIVKQKLKEYMAYKVNSPILFLAFNRLDTTQRVFETIASVKPDRLYIACDGARKNRNEEENVKAVREWLMSNISWKCEVKTLFRENNLGCKLAVSGAITWFFEQEEMGIILEDDCLPSVSFFTYCDDLLNKYRDNPTIMSISGTNHLDNTLTYKESYHFSGNFNCWGWASWRRAWSKYDPDLQAWSAFRKSHKLSKLPHSSFLFVRYWTRIFDLLEKQVIDTWDYQMILTVWNNEGLCICPARNMISNIGFSVEGTHTLDSSHRNSNRKRETISFPLVHPQEIRQNVELDKLENKAFYEITWTNEMKREVKRRLSRIKQFLIRTFLK